MTKKIGLLILAGFFIFVGFSNISFSASKLIMYFDDDKKDSGLNPKYFPGKENPGDKETGYVAFSQKPSLGFARKLFVEGINPAFPKIQISFNTQKFDFLVPKENGEAVSNPVKVRFQFTQINALTLKKESYANDDDLSYDAHYKDEDDTQVPYLAVDAPDSTSDSKGKVTLELACFDGPLPKNEKNESKTGYITLSGDVEWPPKDLPKKNEGWVGLRDCEAGKTVKWPIILTKKGERNDVTVQVADKAANDFDGDVTVPNKKDHHSEEVEVSIFWVGTVKGSGGSSDSSGGGGGSSGGGGSGFGGGGFSSSGGGKPSRGGAPSFPRGGFGGYSDPSSGGGGGLGELPGKAFLSPGLGIFSY